MILKPSVNRILRAVMVVRFIAFFIHCISVRRNSKTVCLFRIVKKTKTIENYKVITNNVCLK